MEEMAWYIPLLIFVGRCCDVPIGTLRMILVVNGYRWPSAILGFFEVIIWVLAAGGAIKYLEQPFAVLAFAGGFATGVMIGMIIENHLAIGYRTMRIINTDPVICLSTGLRERGYRVTRVAGEGRDGPVEIAFVVSPRRHLPEIREAVNEIAPDAFMTIERVDRPHGGGWRVEQANGWRSRISLLRK